MGKKKTATTEPARARMVKELREAIEEIDEEGLLFLLRQAQVLIHNARVEQLNKSSAQKSQGKAPAARKLADASAAASVPVSIEEAKGGKSVFLTIGGARKIMTLEEMKRLVRICYGAETKSDALSQLYTVLARERNDILFDARIGNAGSPLLEALFAEVRATYRLKDR
jgi:hypothetical protein